MDWHYATEGERRGPVSADELRELHRTGAINDDSLVWSEEMDDWRSYRECRIKIEAPAAQPPLSPELESIDEETGEPLATCAWSGRKFPQSRMLRYGDAWVAPGFKDVFVQSLEEGQSPDSTQGPIPAEELVPDLTFVSLITQSAKIWAANLPTIAIVTVTFWIPLNLILEYITYQQTATEESWDEIFNGFRNTIRFDRIAEFWIGSIVTGAIYWIAHQTWIGRPKATIGEAFGAGFRNWGRMLITRFLFGLLLVALIIPALLFFALGEPVFMGLGGIYLTIAAFIYWVRHGFAEPAAISEEEGGSGALNRSRAVTKSRFWIVVGYQILVFGALFTVALIIGMLGVIPVFDNFVVSAILATIINIGLSFGMVEMLVLYHHLKANSLA